MKINIIPLRQLARAALQPQPRGHRQLSNPILDLIQLIDPSGGNRRVIPGPSRLIKKWPAKSPVAKSARPVHPRVPYSQSASSKLRQHLTPITKRGVLPNFIFLDAEQMPGYEKFGKHEIVRNGKTTESPYLVEYVESIQDYSNLVDERTPNRKD